MKMKYAFLLAAVIAAFAFCAVAADAGESDADGNFSVGNTISNLNIGLGQTYDGNVPPGITLTDQEIYGTEWIVASGTFTTAGSYTVNLYDNSHLASTYTFNVSNAAVYYTVTIAAGSGGTVSTSSVTVESGTSYSSSGSTLTIGSNTITASANSGYHFSYWSPSSGTITQNRTITAYFAQDTPYYTVSFARNYTQWGNVSTSSVSVASGTSFSSSGNTLSIGGNTITATANAGYHFDHWSPSSGTITSTTTITAYFAQDVTYYTVNFSAYQNAGGTVSTSSVSVPSGTSYSTSTNTLTIGSNTITASPSTDFRFDHWSSTSGTITANTTIYAYFYATAVTYTLQCSTGGTAYIADTTAGTQSTVANAGDTVSLKVDAGHTVSYNATPDGSHSFTAWLLANNNQQLSTDNPYSLTVSSTLTSTTGGNLIADFDALTMYTVTISAYQNAGGTVSTSSVSVPSGTSYSSSGSTLTIGTNTITATPSEDFAFDHWSSSSGTISAATTIYAYFYATSLTYTLQCSTGGTAYIADTTAGTQSTVANAGETVTLKVDAGHTVSYNATPDNSHSFTAWLIANNLEQISTDNPYTMTAPTTLNHTDAANFIADFDALTMYTVTISAYQNAGGTVSTSSVSVPSGTSYSTSTNTLTIGSNTITASPSTDFRFDHWSSSSGTITSNTTIYAYFYATAVTYTLQCSTGGTAYLADTTAGTQSTVANAGETVTLKVDAGHTVSYNATPDGSHSFTAWLLANNNQQISTDNPYSITVSTTLTSTTGGNLIADFDLIPSDSVYWTNGTDNEPMYNGKISMVYKFDASDNKKHIMDIDLNSATVQNNITSWADSGYSLHIELSYSPLVVTSALLHNGLQVAAPTSVSLGNWSTFEIQMDSQNGTITVIPVKVFNSFTDYSLYENQARKVFDFSNTIKDTSMTVIEHSESGNGANSPKFSVTSTSVFLDTYGVVLYNPTINLHNYFPQYDSIRVNFYSFALYGESITINNTTYVLDGSKVTVQYVTDGKNNYLPGVMPNATTQTKTMDLTNIYVTFDGTSGHVLLTFVNDRFTIDLGAYQSGDWTVSMVGIWYFTSMVYSPYTAYEKSLSDWKMLPETSSAQMLLIFLGILAVAGVAVAIHAKRNNGLGAVDVVIILAAAAVAYILLG